MGRASLRRTVAALALALLAGPALGAGPATPDAMSLGDPKARVVVEEYASLTCPHCARFSAEVFPVFKKKYVDTGKVRYVLHEFLTPPEQVAAAGWLVARCAGPGRYFSVVEAVFASQPRWRPGEIKSVLLGVAKANGMTEAQFEACLTDKAAIDALSARVEKTARESGVQATPTFVVNGKRVKEGEMTLQELDAAIAAASR